ncbi:chaperone modulator CbpM [Martelella alba]|uniref:Chaperone-modulator protein CbpM n=1 Tax=Martelella alba TaxID=2590451 RepID=A0ABY2SKQ3_9HYPH|nr:chaperone modulator CbpM [Martelella alba]TKI06145.1 chaperone-modulator protein CbpM [Martelella alba]
MTDVRVTLEVTEFCQYASISRDELLEVVALGIIAPRGEADDEWRFDTDALAEIRRAQRLRRELELDWPGIALAVGLLDDIRRLKAENRRLRQRLDRFLLK